MWEASPQDDTNANTETDTEIFLYDGSQIIQLTDNNTNDSLPQISGNNVVWRGFDGDDDEIYLYNGSTTIQLTDNNLADKDPQVSGNKVIWQGFDGNDTEIFFYNGSKVIQLTNNNYEDQQPQLSGTNVIWRGFDGHDTEIYLYNGSSTINLSNNTADDFNPKISGNNVTWESATPGNNSEVFLATLPIWSAVTTTLQATLANLILTGTSNINGTGNTLNNRITGNSGNNILNGLAGNDTLIGLAGNDTLNGGAGNDSLTGGAGNDILVGDLGNDQLIGSAGSDRITGGAGVDSFYFYRKTEGVDTITDFRVIDDTIYVSKAGFGGGLTSGKAITSGQFRLGSSAGDSSDRFIYNKTTGALFFDTDGTGISKQIQIAQLSTGLAMTNQDIAVFA
ncbi:MAG TPA: calcium-binding protein [Cyanobacteria bacterium UBA12227]|nr:calcium-binding protein [Cyanobacteria bacterium UBA12227]